MAFNAPGLPNPPGWRDVCAANGVTDQGLGEESAANGAGNPVLYAVVASLWPCQEGKAIHNGPSLGNVCVLAIK